MWGTGERFIGIGKGHRGIVRQYRGIRQCHRESEAGKDNYSFGQIIYDPSKIKIATRNVDLGRCPRLCEV